MNPAFGRFAAPSEDVMVFAFVALFLALVPLPAIVFKCARGWSRDQPQLGSAALAGAVVVVVVAILAVAALVLALIGWLPPPTEWGSIPALVER